MQYRALWVLAGVLAASPALAPYSIGNSPSTKYIIPAEFTELLKPLRALIGDEDTKG